MLIPGSLSILPLNSVILLILFPVGALGAVPEKVVQGANQSSTRQKLSHPEEGG